MKTAKLFGGAFQIDLPDGFVDVSDFRQVPDHQEVWAEAKTDRSAIIEILERVDEKDEQSALFVKKPEKFFLNSNPKICFFFSQKISLERISFIQ